MLPRLPKLRNVPPSRLLWLVLPGLFLWLAAGDVGAREYREAHGVQELSPEEVLLILIDGDGPVVIDARPDPKYAREHIPGAMHVYSKHVWGWIPDLEKYRDRGIVFYCDNGLNSRRAAKKLLGEGFRKVFVMKGYLRRWKALGYPLESSAPE